MSTSFTAGARPGFVDSAQPTLSWGAIAAGAVVTLGLMVLFLSLGVGLGLSSAQLEGSDGVGFAQVFSGTWGAVTPFIALAVGGFVAGRSSGVTSKSAGALHGLVMWGLAAVTVVWLLAGLIQALATGAAAVTGEVFRAAGTVASSAAGVAGSAVRGSGQGAEQLQDLLGKVDLDIGVDVDTALKPINDRLRESGKAAVNVEQIKQAGRSVLQQARRQGKLDREMFIQAIGQNTGISQEDAAATADAIEEQLRQTAEKARSVAGDVAERARGMADDASVAIKTQATRAANATANATKSAFYGLFVALALGLGAAIGGAVLAANTQPRRL